MTHRIDICIDKGQPICFEIEGLSQKQILKIIEVLILLSSDSKEQDTKKPDAPPEIHNKALVHKTEPVLNNLSSSPLATKEKARQFARDLLESGIPEKEARKQTEAKFGPAPCRMGVWRGWCVRWRAEGLLSNPEQLVDKTKPEPVQSQNILVCLRPGIQGLSEADCVQFQCQWNLSGGDVHKAWAQLASCRICPNHKKREDLESRRTKPTGIGYDLSEAHEMRV